MADGVEKKSVDGSGSDPATPCRPGTSGTGAGVLIVVGEIHDPEQKELALQRVVAGLLSWDATVAGFELEQPLLEFVKLQPKGITDPNGETVLEQTLDSIQISILVNPRFQTLQKKLISFLLSDSHYRFLLFSGLTLQSSGCWFLQDGCFSFSSFADVFRHSDVVQASAKQSGAVLDVSVVAEVGEWTKSSLAALSSRLQLRLNPSQSGGKSDGVVSEYLSTFIKTPFCDDLLIPTKTFGSFVQSFPTMHIFPGGQGDSALFGVSGFNLLFDGGYARRSCFWDLTRHLPSLDAVVISHLGPDNLFGIGSFLERKSQDKGYPDLGAVFFNAGETKNLRVDNNQGLLLNLGDKGKQILDKVHEIGVPVIQCLGHTQGHALQPINLYHKVGHGSVDLYVLNPLGENKETKDLLLNWTKSIGSHKGGVSTLDHLSICSVLVWKPMSPNEKPVRILFPGNTPQAKIFEGLERLKMVNMFQNASGISGLSKGLEKAGGKAQVVKGKPPPAGKIENKETKKPVAEQKPGSDQQKESRKGAEQKEAKKAVGEQKEGKRAVSAEPKNGKATKMDLAVKSTPAVAKTVKKTESEPVKLSTKKTTAKKHPAPLAAGKAVAGQGSTVEDEKLVVDKVSAYPPPSEADEPLDVLTALETKTEVQALPEPAETEEELVTVEEEDVEVEQDVTMGAEDGNTEMEEPEHSEENLNSGGSTSAKAEDGSQEDVEAESNEAFDPANVWGIPDALPAPVNGKELAAAKRSGHNLSMTTTGSTTKKADAPKAAEAASKVVAKRPITAPDRLNNTTREETETSAKSRPTTSYKDAAGFLRPEPKKQPAKPVVPFYVDVAYIPSHGSLQHFDVDFFRRIRARYYVLSSVAPNTKVLALLAEGKESWEDSNGEVTIIPTYDSESMISWIMENANLLKRLKITVSPPASKCTMQLQEIDTVCASYRLEF